MSVTHTESNHSFPPPSGCTDEDLLSLIDLCPFLASDRIKYNDEKVLYLLRQNPRAACLRAPFHRFGIGTDLHPLPLVVALGGSLEVVKIMVNVCPEALGERLSGRRTLIHYAISEGVNVEIIKYLLSQYPEYLTETDSYNAIPLHLAASYPASSLSVLELLLNLHPNGAKSLDNQSQTPLHRACKSRVSVEKVMALLEVAPCVLSWRDWCGNTPLVIADRMDHRLGDVIPEVVELLELVREILTIGLELNIIDDNNGVMVGATVNEMRQRGEEILMRFRSMRWQGGISMVFAHNVHLFSLLNVPTALTHEFLSLVCGGKSWEVAGVEELLDDVSSSYRRTNRLNSVFMLLRHHPWMCETPNI